MNRFIELSRRSSSIPFRISIYRNDREYYGYGAVCYSGVKSAKTRQVTQDSVLIEFPMRKNG